MTHAKVKPKFKTFDEFLRYDDGTDTRYEVVNGNLVEMPTESPLNLDIAFFLATVFLQHVPRPQIGFKHLIAVDSASVTAREPDLVVHSKASKQALNNEKQALLLLSSDPPVLLIEVVSPGEPGSQNYQRDYVEKPQEYAKRGIPEFWLVDPTRKVILVLSLVGNAYKSTEFRGDDPIQSPTFKDLQLTANQVFAAGQ